jgi:ubiquinone/menaquinone biosynthesis C-methylase UbiE
MKAKRFEDLYLRGFFLERRMEDLRDYFDRHASSWDEMLKYNERTSELLEVVSWFGLAEGHWVLDVGTGTGILLPLIRQAIGPKGKLIGFDFSFKMLEKAKLRQCPGGKILINATVESLPFQSGIFDQIICFSALPHFPNKLKALLEMARVLKSEGSLYIAHLKSVEELNQFHQSIGGPVAQDLLPQPERIRSLMTESGLLEVSIINRPGKFLAQGRKL